MNAAEYQKLAHKCEKHIKGLAIALAGVAKAEAAGQRSLIQSSVHRAQDCVSDVIDCMGSTQDQELLEPLYRMDAALVKLDDGKRVAEIEKDMRQFQDRLAAKQQQIKAPSSHQLAYAGNPR